jgi:hypothetical protein
MTVSDQMTKATLSWQLPKSTTAKASSTEIRFIIIISIIVIISGGSSSISGGRCVIIICCCSIGIGGIIRHIKRVYDYY